MSINVRQQLKLESELLTLLIARTDAGTYDPLIVIPALLSVVNRIRCESLKAAAKSLQKSNRGIVERFLDKIERAAAAPVVKALRRNRVKILID